VKDQYSLFFFFSFPHGFIYLLFHRQFGIGRSCSTTSLSVSAKKLVRMREARVGHHILLLLNRELVFFLFLFLHLRNNIKLTCVPYCGNQGVLVRLPHSAV